MVMFWHLYQIHTFINNLNDKEMSTSHLMRTFLWLFYDKNMFERSKKHSVIAKWIIKFRNFLPSVNFSLKSWFSEPAVHRCFSKYIFLKILQYSQENTCASLLLQNTYGSCFWMFASATESGIYCCQPHRFLLWTSLETWVKRQKQPLKLLCKRGVFKNFTSFTGKQLCWSLILIELQTFADF